MIGSTEYDRLAFAEPACSGGWRESNLLVSSFVIIFVNSLYVDKSLCIQCVAKHQKSIKKIAFVFSFFSQQSLKTFFAKMNLGNKSFSLLRFLVLPVSNIIVFNEI